VWNTPLNPQVWGLPFINSFSPRIGGREAISPKVVAGGRFLLKLEAGGFHGNDEIGRDGRCDRQKKAEQ